MSRRENLQVGLLAFAVAAFIGWGAWLDATGQVEDEPIDVPASVEFGDGDGYPVPYEREWGK